VPIHGRPRIIGFTLIEMVAVVVLIALLYALLLPNLGIRGRRELDGEAERLRAALELARLDAIATGTRHRLVLHFETGRYLLQRWEVPDVEPAAKPAQPADPRELPDLRAPRPVRGSFVGVPGRAGRTHALSDRVVLLQAETPDGPVRHGLVGVEFRQDGTAEPTVIRLANDQGDVLDLEVLPLADTVRIRVPE
jgi:prepilin-type N-terminal cleavage/methylation domain-containing protein